ARRAGGEGAVLPAQVGAALDVGVDGAVPAVDRPVVEGELAGLGDAALVQHGAGVLVVAEWQQRGEVARVLLEEVEHGGDPALAEADAGPHALGLELVRTR